MSWWCMYVVTRVHVSISMLYAVSYTWGGSVKSTLAGRSTSHSQLSPTHEHHACEALIISRTPSLLFLSSSYYRRFEPTLSLSPISLCLRCSLLCPYRSLQRPPIMHMHVARILGVQISSKSSLMTMSITVRGLGTDLQPFYLSSQTFQSIFDCSPHSFGN